MNISQASTLIILYCSDINTESESRDQSLLEAYTADESKQPSLSPWTFAAAVLHAAFDRSDRTKRPALSELFNSLNVLSSTISERKSLLLEHTE